MTLPLAALFDEFCNSPDEFHAGVLGLIQGLDPDPNVDANGLPLDYPADVRAYCRDEWHYWRFFRFVGRVIRRLDRLRGRA